MHVTVDKSENQSLMTKAQAESSQAVRARVAEARQCQANRQNKHNSQLTSQELKQLANINRSALALLNQASEQLQLSSRSYIRCLRLARSIADLDRSTSVADNHIAEALQFRA